VIKLIDEISVIVDMDDDMYSDFRQSIYKKVNPTNFRDVIPHEHIKCYLAYEDDMVGNLSNEFRQTESRVNKVILCIEIAKKRENAIHSFIAKLSDNCDCDYIEPYPDTWVEKTLKFIFRH
jgi:hypothetical protein